MKIAVGTYNISHCNDFTAPICADGKAVVNVEHTAKLFKQMKCDIMGLNEVYDYGSSEDLRNQTEKLANLSGYSNFYFAKAKEFEWKDIIGNAILSKYKITDVQTFSVPAPEESERDPNENKWYEDRIIVKATIDIGKRINVISTHFGLNRSEQLRMVEALIHILDINDKPCILLGDFNAEPHSKILQPIYNRLRSVADTAMQTEAYTWASYAPQKTLDYIFASDEFIVKSFMVVKKIVSDHFPIKSVLEIN